MKVLYIGGTGEISQACVEQAQRAGHRVSVFNRGLRNDFCAEGVEQITGDINSEPSYSAIATQKFDVVCQFLAYNSEQVQRDIAFFSGRCQQYMFISTASAYQKINAASCITEQRPLQNPFWQYSRNKAVCEALLLQAHADQKLPVTIVRPSHTYRTRMPSTIIDGDHMLWRLRHKKAVPIHDNGESLWALTHASDFAEAFVKLCGNPSALGECVHITQSQSHSWNTIYKAIADSINVTPTICPIPTPRLIQYNPEWEGPLLGDKANSVVFDNAKIKKLCKGWQAKTSLQQGLSQVLPFVDERLSQGYRPNPELDALIDRITADG